MKRKLRRTLIIISAVVLTAIALAKLTTTRIEYSRKDVYKITDFTFQDSVFIREGHIAVGRNRAGAIEASIIPSGESECGGQPVDYLYMRFDPVWFLLNIKGKLQELPKSQFVRMEPFLEIHRENFDHFSHINDKPLIIPGFLAGNVRLADESGRLYWILDGKVQTTEELRNSIEQ